MIATVTAGELAAIPRRPARNSPRTRLRVDTEFQLLGMSRNSLNSLAIA